MKFAIPLVASLAFINAAFSSPLSSYSNSTVKRQSQQQLTSILTDMEDVISKLGATDRADFTQKLIDKLFYYNGLYSYIVCHVKHEYNGQEGVDWAHYKTTFHDYQYDIVIGQVGIFTRYGAGGSTNWQYSTAWVKSATDSGGATTVVFKESS